MKLKMKYTIRYSGGHFILQNSEEISKVKALGYSRTAYITNIYTGKSIKIYVFVYI